MSDSGDPAFFDSRDPIFNSRDLIRVLKHLKKPAFIVMEVFTTGILPTRRGLILQSCT